MKSRLRPLNFLGAAPIVFFLLLPPVALLVRGQSGAIETIGQESTRTAIWVSLKTTCVALVLVVILGMPLCWILAHWKGGLARVLDALVDLPVVLPPAAAGIGLLIAFGRHGLIPTGLPFTTGAVICAQFFVSAPLFIRSGTAAILTVSKEIVEVARTEGAGPMAIFQNIILPIGGPIFGAGIAMAWARSLGEFGATLLFAGNLPGKTQTMPLAIYLGFETDLDQAIGLSMILLIIAGGVLLATKILISLRTSVDTV